MSAKMSAKQEILHNVFLNPRFQTDNSGSVSLPINVPFKVHNMIIKPVILHSEDDVDKLLYITSNLVDGQVIGYGNANNGDGLTSKCATYTFPSGKNINGTYKFNIFDTKDGSVNVDNIWGIIHIEFWGYA